METNIADNMGSLDHDDGGGDGGDDGDDGQDQGDGGSGGAQGRTGGGRRPSQTHRGMKHHHHYHITKYVRT